MKTICAFSSDSRDLYKADIYKVLSYPKNHIVHFRYKLKYVDETLLQDADIKDRDVAIFFSAGNTQERDRANLKNISIRMATLVNHEISKETGVFHAYLKLKDFCDIKLSEPDPKLDSKFFCDLATVINKKSCSWQDRIEQVKTYIPNLTFFHIKGIFEKHREEQLIHTNDNRSCYYQLHHGKTYYLKVALGNPNSTDSKIKITETSGHVTINCLNPLITTADYDDIEIPLLIKRLDTNKHASLITFNPKDTESEFSTNLELSLTMDLAEPLKFALFTTPAAIAVYLVQAVNPSFIYPTPLALFVAAVLFFVSSMLLYYFFNKK